MNTQLLVLQNLQAWLQMNLLQDTVLIHGESTTQIHITPLQRLVTFLYILVREFLRYCYYQVYHMCQMTNFQTSFSLPIKSVRNRYITISLRVELGCWMGQTAATTYAHQRTNKGNLQSWRYMIFKADSPVASFVSQIRRLKSMLFWLSTFRAAGGLEPRSRLLLLKLLNLQHHCVCGGTLYLLGYQSFFCTSSPNVYMHRYVSKKVRSTGYLRNWQRRQLSYLNSNMTTILYKRSKPAGIYHLYNFFSQCYLLFLTSEGYLSIIHAMPIGQ